MCKNGICGRHIQRQRRLMNDCEPNKCFYIDIMGVRCQRVDEEDDCAQLFFSRQSTNLLIATQRTAQQPSDL